MVQGSFVGKPMHKQSLRRHPGAERAGAGRQPSAPGGGCDARAFAIRLAFE